MDQKAEEQRKEIEAREHQLAQIKDLERRCIEAGYNIRPKIKDERK